ncbi:MAG: ribbon-helix-helix domain-containing protein [Candidatus Woesearchaeota archaeon]
MESITIKVEDDFARQIEKAMKPMYTTKTEFIREAIRDKISAQREQILRKYLGISKTKTTYAEEKRIRRKVAKKYLAKFGLK